MNLLLSPGCYLKALQTSIPFWMKAHYQRRMTYEILHPPQSFISSLTSFHLPDCAVLFYSFIFIFCQLLCNINTGISYLDSHWCFSDLLCLFSCFSNYKQTKTKKGVLNINMGTREPKWKWEREEKMPLCWGRLSICQSGNVKDSSGS